MTRTRLNIIIIIGIIVGFSVLEKRFRKQEEIKPSKDVSLAIDTIIPLPLFKVDNDTIRAIRCGNGITILVGRDLTDKEISDLIIKNINIRHGR